MSRRKTSLLRSSSTQTRSIWEATSPNCSVKRAIRACADENRRAKKPASFSAAGSSPRALPRMSDRSLPVVPSSRFCVWARMRSANSTTERWARSPKVTMRERSEISISDLMRATADASACTAGTLMVSLTPFLLPACSHDTMGHLGKITASAADIDDRFVSLRFTAPFLHFIFNHIAVRRGQIQIRICQRKARRQQCAP